MDKAVDGMLDRCDIDAPINSVVERLKVVADSVNAEFTVTTKINGGGLNVCVTVKFSLAVPAAPDCRRQGRTFEEQELLDAMGAARRCLSSFFGWRVERGC